MKREKLEEHLSKKVKVKLFDNDEFEGFLRRTGEDDFKNNPNLYIPVRHYFLVDDNLNCVSCIFRSSHVVNIKSAI